MISARSQSQLCAATPISSLCSVLTFHFGLCLRHSPHFALILLLFLILFQVTFNLVKFKSFEI